MKPIPFKSRRQSSRRPNVRKIGTAVLLVALAAFAGYANLSDGASGRSGGDATDFGGRVTQVVDGDTFRISSTGERVRLWGLNAPEVSQPGGSVATAALSRLTSGQEPTCRQRDIDRFGRIVGQCFLPDGRDITAVMIASGTAQEYCRFSGNHYRTC